MTRARLERRWRPPDDVALERATLWSCTFHRLFGVRGRGDALPSGIQPMSLAAACDALQGLAAPPLRPLLLHHCLTQMLAAGYTPAGTGEEKCFEKLACEATHLASQQARAVLRAQARAQRAAAVTSVGPAPTAVTRGVGGAEPVELVGPTVVSFDGTAYTATKEALVHRPLRELAPEIDPENWERLSPFFEEVRAVCKTPSAGAAGPSWHGELYERFVVNWNQWAVQRFETYLKIDYTVTDDVVRLDYSLMYELDDQLLVDDGFGEARKVPGRIGWSWYKGVKSIKFTSSFLNLLAPGVLCMTLDRQMLSMLAGRRPPQLTRDRLGPEASDP